MLDGAPREVFRHVKELEEVGLAAPQVTYIMHTLKEAGLVESAEATTLPEAVDEICRSFGMTRRQAEAPDARGTETKKEADRC